MKRPKSLKNYKYPVTVAVIERLKEMKGIIYDDSQIEASPDAIARMVQENNLNEGKMDGCPYSVFNNVLLFDDHPIIVSPKLDGISFVIGGLIEKKSIKKRLPHS